MPARSISSTVFRDSEAGPMVQTILVLFCANSISSPIPIIDVAQILVLRTYQSMNGASLSAILCRGLSRIAHVVQNFSRNEFDVEVTLRKGYFDFSFLKKAVDLLADLASR
jgi:hypothetical protein